MLPSLENRKSEIEKAIGQKLLWNPNPDNRDKVIVLLHSTDLNDQQKVEEALNWLVDHTLKFRETFSKILKKAP